MPLEARSDFAVLASLVEHGPLSQTDLGRALGLDRANVNGIVTRLEGGGAISRTTDPSDRRRNVVRVTDAGRARLAALQEHATAVQGRLLAELDEIERRELVRLLDKVLAGHPVQPA